MAREGKAIMCRKAPRCTGSMIGIAAIEASLTHAKCASLQDTPTRIHARAHVDVDAIWRVRNGGASGCVCDLTTKIWDSLLSVKLQADVALDIERRSRMTAWKCD
jgi:hypothetical protein